jgi:NAD(P)H-flavin reductase
MHLTKRFGIIAASQLPMHFLLAMKSPYSPLQFLLGASHASLNSLHRVLARIILLLLALHASFYLNFFLRNAILAKRLGDRDVIVGLTCLAILLTISSSALPAVRRWNYRLFYAIHVLAPAVLLPLLFLHVRHVRPYVVESAVVMLLNLATRLYTSTTLPMRLTMVPGTTSLVEISATKPVSMPRWNPGQHVYIRSPDGGPLSYLRSNPFTISNLQSSQNDADRTPLILVARALDGSTRRLAAEASAAAGGLVILKTIEGPYGPANPLPDLARFQRILLVAGGVGATFTVPLWRHVVETRAALGLGHHQHLRLVWAVRTLPEVGWAVGTFARIGAGDLPGSPGSGGRGGDERDIHVTAGAREVDGEIDMMSTADDLGDSEAAVASILENAGFGISRQRPDLRAIVDETLAASSTGPAAVIVCGPPAMTRAMRNSVERWVLRGHDVLWHAEQFGI